MKVSIITCTYNSEKTILDTINSVNTQGYHNIEHIIIDGNSNDRTLEIVNNNKTDRQVVLSENDEGLYDAINKGIRLSSGEIVGVLNSDDSFFDFDVIESIVDTFKEHNVDTVFADIAFTSPLNNNKLHRYYSSRFFKPSLLRFGYMPAHPTFYVKKDIYSQFGLYKINYKIAADFEMILRLLFINKVKYKYINKCLVNMSLGGKSTKDIMSKFIINSEVLRACKENKVYTNYIFISFKYVYKTFGFVIAFMKNKNLLN